MIYFIQQGADGPIKIGHTTNPRTRIPTLQTGSPVRLRLLKTIPGGRSRESQIHGQLSGYRLEGEWFSPAPAVWKLVNTIDQYEYRDADGEMVPVIAASLTSDISHRGDFKVAVVIVDACPYCGERDTFRMSGLMSIQMLVTPRCQTHLKEGKKIFLGLTREAIDEFATRELTSSRESTHPPSQCSMRGGIPRARCCCEYHPGHTCRHYETPLTY